MSNKLKLQWGRCRVIIAFLLLVSGVVLSAGESKLVHAEPPAAADNFVGVNPTRFMDTRPGAQTYDGQFEGTGKVGSGQVRLVKVAGRINVPNFAGAVALNVTAVDPTDASYVTVWPTGSDQPTASNLNLRAGVTAPNMVIVPVGADGQISLFNASGSTHLLVDVLGWFPAGSGFTGLNPARVLDTRPGSMTIDGQFAGSGSVAGPSVTNVTIAGRGGVPDGAQVGAVALNVTAVSPTDASYVTVWPTGSDQPTASNLNLNVGVTAPNMVIVPVGADGQISLFNASGSTHLLVDVLGWFPVNALAASTARVNVSSEGAQANGPAIGRPSISANGRLVAFESNASNLVSGDTNSSRDVFVRDQWTGTTTLVSRSSAGVQGDGMSKEPEISGDGRFVVFSSAATNLVANDSNASYDIFRHDRLLGTTERVSVKTNGAEAAGNSTNPTVNIDGSVIAFVSDAADIANEGNLFDDVFVRNMLNESTTLASRKNVFDPANGNSGEPSLSADGATLVYSSDATNLIGNDTNNATDVFVRNSLGLTARVSVGYPNKQGDGDSDSPRISGDGNTVVFVSEATNLAWIDDGIDDNLLGDVFRRDLVKGITRRIGEPKQGNDWSSSPSISFDGRYISFESRATNLVDGDSNAARDIFVLDGDTYSDGPTLRVSVNTAGTEADQLSGYPQISANGRYIAFLSYATNLVNGDSNSNPDVFVFDQGTQPLKYF